MRRTGQDIQRRAGLRLRRCGAAPKGDLSGETLVLLLARLAGEPDGDADAARDEAGLDLQRERAGLHRARAVDGVFVEVGDEDPADGSLAHRGGHDEELWPWA